MVLTGSSPFAGADMITFFAPALRWVDACSLVLKIPVDSMTTSILSSFQGNFVGSLIAKTLISLLSTLMD